ncbi:PTS mannose/fructose/sorbose/N-acetylgalactosamine transporter subunit IIC [Enterococcus sp. CSURQ0835]|uniref:PTS mannose/fructose/sorbose/N-acetylgalactosamine transporter subunit IIC n=1 Tax=Enterococcus sp. CSURQ0835 TaxID=2681394 RepID=UPI001359DD48|nr:PTS sugar transporter subunit IIC [Enterococcus sp. CSURQ0835]
MDSIQMWQIIILTIYSFLAINESLMGNIGLIHPVFAGMLTGIVMGDLTLGLSVGGTLQLMQLGISAFGGASIPDFFTGAVVGTVFGILSGKGLNFAIGLAVPVGLLMVQLDIVARFTNTFLLHKIDKAIEEVNTKKIEYYTLLGALPWGLSRALPIMIILIFGEPIINVILNYLPDAIMGGLKVAGGVLPVVGIAILLRYLPTKQYIPYFIVGIVLAAYLKLPILGITLIGIALAILDFKKVNKKSIQAVIEKSTFEGGFAGDE